jgi:hypothetical protein
MTDITWLAIWLGENKISLLQKPPTDQQQCVRHEVSYGIDLLVSMKQDLPYSSPFLSRLRPAPKQSPRPLQRPVVQSAGQPLPKRRSLEKAKG